MARKGRGPKPDSIHAKKKQLGKAPLPSTESPPPGPPGPGAGWTTQIDPDMDRLLICAFDQPAAQHAAMARIEAWYEAPGALDDHHGNDHDGSDGDGADDDGQNRVEDRCACSAERYVSLAEAQRRRLCANYQGFNFPLAAVYGWLRSMALADPLVASARTDAHSDAHLNAHLDSGSGSGSGLGSRSDADADADPMPPQNSDWWRPACNAWEATLLDHLVQRGVRLPAFSSPSESHALPVENEEGGKKEGEQEGESSSAPLGLTQVFSQGKSQEKVRGKGKEGAGPPTYLVSTLSSPAGRGAVLAHERQHALFFFSPLYAAACRAWFPHGVRKTQRTTLLALASTLSSRGWPPPAPLHSAGTTKTILGDFRMRGYARAVWVDEWQAHLSPAPAYVDKKEFGGKAAAEVGEVAPLLHAVSQSELAQLRDG